MSRYLLMQTIVNASCGLLVGGARPALRGAVEISRDRPPLHSVRGAAIAALAPLAVSLAVCDGRTRPLFVAGLFLVVELFSNLVLETVLYAGSAGVLARVAASQPQSVVIGSAPPVGHPRPASCIYASSDA